MNTPQVTAAVVVLLFAGSTISWKAFSRSGLPDEPAATTEAKAVSSEARDEGNLDFAAAFVSDPDSLSDDDYQQAARAYEAQKQAQRAAAKRPGDLGDPAAPYRRWRRRVEEAREMVSASEAFPEGSIQWHLREELKQLLQEEPRRR